MSDIAIKVAGLGKQYRIGAREQGHKTFRESLMDTFRLPFRRLGVFLRGRNGGPQDQEDTIWALKDVSFEIKSGEVVGVIGPNGAGKSTLLKILSRITEPTTGRAEIRGRVGSLLEVGTGFHSELTGRENIFLNGAILGMHKAEIDRKFDEIVAFSEVEKFIDTPVKRYSSGMYLRLAFAVAAHLDPEILLVDEVLAVGDAAFQKKCLGKMGDVANEGRTVLFVSHNINAIQRLCPQSIWIDGGQLIRYGESNKLVHDYLCSSSKTYLSGNMELSNWPNRYGSGEARILSACISDPYQNTTTIVYRAGFMAVEFIFDSNYADTLHFSMSVVSDSNDNILHLSYYDTPGVMTDSLIGKYRARFEIPTLPLCAGNYSIALGIHTQNMIAVDVVLNVLPFKADDMEKSPRPYKTVKEYAYCWTPNHFSIAPLD